MGLGVYLPAIPKNPERKDGQNVFYGDIRGETGEPDNEQDIYKSTKDYEENNTFWIVGSRAGLVLR